MNDAFWNHFCYVHFDHLYIAINSNGFSGAVLMCNQSSPNTQSMEKKFELWSLTSKYLLFCKLEASRISKGSEWKDVNGKDCKNFIKII